MSYFLARQKYTRRSQSVFYKLWTYRSLSSPATSSVETVEVRCQSNGSITLDIHQPLDLSLPLRRPPAVLIYLPRGPFWPNKEHDDSTVSILRASLPCPVVQINYRLNGDHPYPTPVHDVLAGYDWIQEHLIPRRAIVSPGLSNHTGRVAVCGELIGGGLAAALALTECRIGESGVVAAALNNPVVDWVSFPHDSNAIDSTSESTMAALLTSELSHLRSRLFKKPEQYFDPFASPILFFRSAGVDVPPAKAQIIDDFEQLSAIEKEDFYRQQLALSASSTTHVVEEESTFKDVAKSKRKASRRFPSKSSRLHLPQFTILATNTSPFCGQAKELTHVLRQSFARQSKYAASLSRFGRRMLPDNEDHDEDELRLKTLRNVEAAEKAQLRFCEDIGLWDGSVRGRTRLDEVAKWLRAKLA